MQCLAIDWGTKRIGLGLGNTETKLASPFGFVESLDALLDIAKKEEIDQLVIGMPFHSQGGDKALDPAFTAFLEALEARSGLPIIRLDERFSSQLADSLGTGNKRDGSRDAVAAMVILQSYFDSL